MFLPEWSQLELASAMNLVVTKEWTSVRLRMTPIEAFNLSKQSFINIFVTKFLNVTNFWRIKSLYPPISPLLNSLWQQNVRTYRKSSNKSPGSLLIQPSKIWRKLRILVTKLLINLCFDQLNASNRVIRNRSPFRRANN